jgi:uroporphyrinogen-III synthase
VVRPDGRNAEWMRRLEEQGAKVLQVGAFNVYFRQ